MNTRQGVITDKNKEKAENEFKTALSGFVTEINQYLAMGPEAYNKQNQDVTALSFKIVKTHAKAIEAGIVNPDPKLFTLLKDAMDKLITAYSTKNAELRAQAKQAVGETLKAVQENTNKPRLY